MLVSEIIGAEKTKVDIVRDGKKRSIMIGRKIQGEIELIEGKEKTNPLSLAIQSIGWVLI